MSVLPQEYNEILQDIAEKAERGDYGDNPWHYDEISGPSESRSAMLQDAWERVGKNFSEEWFSNDDPAKTGGVIMEEVRFRYDVIVRSDAIENSINTIEAFNDEKEMSDKYQQAKPPETIDDVVLRPETSQAILDLFADRNRDLIKTGKEPVTFLPETISELERRGFSVDRSFAKDEGRPSAVENTTDVDRDDNESKVGSPPTDAPERPETYNDDHTGAPTTGLSGDAPASQEKDVSNAPEVTAANEMQNAPVSDDTNDISALEDAGFRITYDENGRIADLGVIDLEHFSLSDVFREMCEADPEAMQEIASTMELLKDMGEDYISYFKEAITEWAESFNEDKVDSESRGITGDESGTEGVMPADGISSQVYYEEKYNYHDQVIKERSFAVPHRDTFTSFHVMAKVYDAYKGGIEINGKVPTVVDVFLAVNDHLKTNLLESIVTEVFRFVVEAFSDNENKDVESSGVDADYSDVPGGKEKVDTATDAFGIRDNGYIEASADKDALSGISAFRETEPMAGKFYGADMASKADNADSDRYPPGMRVFSTNPDKVDGRGISVGLDNGRAFTFADIRMVEYKGERMLVDPFGKVVDAESGNSRYKIGSYIQGLDISASKGGSAALDTYARDNKLSLTEAKTQISDATKERFCDRIEKTYQIEAKAIHGPIMQREVEAKAELDSKNSALEIKEKIAVATGDKATANDISQIRGEIKEAAVAIGSRIVALEVRASHLDKLADKVSRSPDRPLESRFADAVSSEKSATGRTVTSIDSGLDRNKIEKAVSDAVGSIRAAVEKYNADKPEMEKVSYDLKTGDIVSRWGITTDGEYVGNTNGKFLADGVDGPMGKEDEKDYIDQHFDKEVTLERILGIDIEKQSDVEKDTHDSPVEYPEDRPDTASDLGARDTEIFDLDDFDTIDPEDDMGLESEDEADVEKAVFDDPDLLDTPGLDPVFSSEEIDADISPDDTDIDLKKDPDTISDTNLLEDAVADDMSGEDVADAFDDTDEFKSDDTEKPDNPEAADHDLEFDMDPEEFEADMEDTTHAKRDEDRESGVDADIKPSEKGDKDAIITDISAADAVDAGRSGDGKRDSDKPEEDRDRRDEIEDIVNSMFECADSEDTDLDGTFGAQVDNLETLLEGIDDADTMERTIQDIADIYVEKLANRLDGEDAQYNKAVEAGGEVLESIAQSLGLENGFDLIDKVYDASEHPEMDPLTADGIQDSTRDASDSLHMREVELEECDFGDELGYVTSEGLVDAISGVDTGDFLNDTAVDEFENDVDCEMDGIINGVDFIQNDVEFDADGVDIPELDMDDLSVAADLDDLAVDDSADSFIDPGDMPENIFNDDADFDDEIDFMEI